MGCCEACCKNTCPRAQILLHLARYPTLPFSFSLWAHRVQGQSGAVHWKLLIQAWPPFAKLSPPPFCLPFAYFLLGPGSWDRRQIKISSAGGVPCVRFPGEPVSPLDESNQSPLWDNLSAATTAHLRPDQQTVKGMSPWAPSHTTKSWFNAFNLHCLKVFFSQKVYPGACRKFKKGPCWGIAALDFRFTANIDVTGDI